MEAGYVTFDRSVFLGNSVVDGDISGRAGVAATDGESSDRRSGGEGVVEAVDCEFGVELLAGTVGDSTELSWGLFLAGSTPDFVLFNA